MERLFKRKIILLYSLCLLGFITGIPVSAKNIRVNPANGNPIRQAIDRATDGDTITLAPGIYRPGALKMNKNLTLIGVSNTILDGEGKYEILVVEAFSAKIVGLTFINSGRSGFQDIAALKIVNSKNIIIKNCRFQNDYFAILTQNSHYITYENNDLKSSDIKGGIPAANGIHCWKSDHLTIRNNKISGHRDGIYLEFATNSIIENNISENNARYGMHFMFSVDNIYQNNVFKNNGAGVAVMYSKRVVMRKNQFLENWGGAAYGLLLKEIDDSKIENNRFYKNTTAIFGDGSNRMEIKNNDFQSNGWALKINASSMDWVVTRNNFLGNTFDMATNGELSLKQLSHNYWDKYEGYDLNRNGIGDVAYRPVTFYSLIIEQNEGALMLFRSFFVKLLDKAESVFPNLTPHTLEDKNPFMRKIKF